MRDPVVSGNETSDRIDLILHQGDERGYDYRRAFHDKGRKLVAQGFSTSGRHQHKGVVAACEVADYTFLISFERVETEEFLQF